MLAFFFHHEVAFAVLIYALSFCLVTFTVIGGLTAWKDLNEKKD